MVIYCALCTTAKDVYGAVYSRSSPDSEWRSNKDLIALAKHLLVKVKDVDSYSSILISGYSRGHDLDYL